MKYQRPSRYVNVRSDVVYSSSLSATHLRTYARLAGLAWVDRQRHTDLPPLTDTDLCELLECNPSSVWGHLNALRDFGLIRWEKRGGHYEIRLVPAAENASETFQSFEKSINDDVDSDLNRDSTTSSINSEINPDFQTFEKTRDALAHFGVDTKSAAAERVLRLKYITVALILAWGNHLAATCTGDNLAGALLYQLERTKLPPDVERRGGARRGKAPAQQTELPLASEPLPALPDEVMGSLATLGWADTTLEVQRIFASQPALVTAWLDYAQSIRDIHRSRAGLFRNGIRSGQMPPQRTAPPAPPVENVSEEFTDEEVCEIDADPNLDPYVLSAWSGLRQYLQTEMPPREFQQFVRPARPTSCSDGVFIIQAADAYTRDWLAGRLTHTAQRYLSGAFNQPTRVSFITLEEK